MDVDEDSSVASGAAAGQAAKPLKMVTFMSAKEIPKKFRMCGEVPEAFTGTQLQPKGKQSSKYMYLLLELDDQEAAFELAKQLQGKKRTAKEPRRYACLICLLEGDYSNCLVKCTDEKGKFKSSPQSGHIKQRRGENNKVGLAHQRWWNIINPNGTRVEARMEDFMQVSHIPRPLAPSLSTSPSSHLSLMTPTPTPARSQVLDHEQEQDEPPRYPHPPLAGEESEGPAPPHRPRAQRDLRHRV